jgi:hypothetical protein
MRVNEMTTLALQRLAIDVNYEVGDTGMVRDIEIRNSLKQDLAALHAHESGTRIVEELGLCQGIARVDLAVVNGRIHGYEIKSESDTLARLPGQIAAYGRSLEYVTIVVSPSHLRKVVALIPFWWGVLRAVKRNNGLSLVRHRIARPNPALTPYSLAQLLWRDEALQALADFGLADGLRSKPRHAIWQRLCMAFSVEELGAIVREKLKARREDWRPL